MNFSIKLKLTKETKGTFVYSCDESQENAGIRTLYVSKSAVPSGAKAPAFITVTVEG